MRKWSYVTPGIPSSVIARDEWSSLGSFHPRERALNAKYTGDCMDRKSVWTHVVKDDWLITKLLSIDL